MEKSNYRFLKIVLKMIQKFFLIKSSIIQCLINNLLLPNAILRNIE